MCTFPKQVDGVSGSESSEWLTPTEFAEALGKKISTIRTDAARGNVWYQPILRNEQRGYHARQLDLYRCHRAAPEEDATWLAALDALRKSVGGARTRVMRMTRDMQKKARAAS